MQPTFHTALHAFHIKSERCCPKVRTVALLLHAISKAKANYVLHEIHEGVCGSHAGSRMLAHKAIKFGYFWPHMNEDSVNIV